MTALIELTLDGGKPGSSVGRKPDRHPKFRLLAATTGQRL
jgi:hypothetical protein